MTSSSSTAMTTQVPHRGLRILSLDGGGVKGLSSLLILEYLMKGIDHKNPPRPCEIFDLIGGTSTGGLIAIMLGRLRMSVADAIDAYLDLSKKVFAPKHRFNVIATLSNLSQAKGTCNTVALETAIKKIIVDQLGAGHEDDLLLEEDFLCRIFVCAIRAERRSLIRFRNFPAEGVADLQPKIWEAARATSAATTFFDPITIGKYEQTFVDGGGGYNNPVQEAYEEATTCWDNPPRDIECIVSIGTGKGSLKAFGRNLKQVGQTLIDIVTDTDDKAATFARVHPEYDREGADRRYFRFQVAQGLESVGMAEHKKIKEMAAATQIYMENTDQAGSKQLKLFKNLIGGTCGENTYFKVSGVALEPEKVAYIERFAKLLEFQSPRLLFPVGKAYYSSGTVSLPKRLLCTSEGHRLSKSMTFVLPSPTWVNVLAQYKGDATEDLRKTRVSVHDATWCRDYGGLFAIEVPVIDVWRIIASFNPWYANYTNEPNTDTEIHVHDLWISVPSALHSQPLVHMAFRPESVFAPYDRAYVPSEEFAVAMCGGKGLVPDQACSRKLYSSREAGWEFIKVPIAFAFVIIPPQNRCYFTEQWESAKVRCGCMLIVCGYLWDHADAIECNESGTPVKVLFEEAMADLKLNKDGSVEYVGELSCWKLQTLSEMAEAGLQSSLESADAFVEIEDAVTLLMKADQYTSEDKTFWDEDGTNRIVDHWQGYFGMNRARWVALHMTIKFLLNLGDALVFPQSFDALLHSASGNCFIA